VSKLTKFFKTPRLFFEDSRKKTALKLVSKMSSVDLLRFSKVTGTNLGMLTKGTHSGSNDTRNDDLLLANKLLNFERSYPVNSLISGVDNASYMLWPYLRHLLWVRCQGAYKGKNVASINTSKMYISKEWQEHYQKTLAVKSLENILPDKCDYLFFTNLRGTEQTLIDGKIYNRITDPVFEVAKTLGVAKKVEVIKSVGEINPERVHDTELVLPPLLRKIGYAALTDVPPLFFTRVNQLLPEAQFSNKSYNECIEWFFHQRNFFKELLLKYNPKVIFFVGFDYHYALICAAKELGITSVDLQHGVQAGWSPVYNHWQAVPSQGYEMLPNRFWVWGEYDASKIEKNFPCESVKPLVGGFPWLDRQLDFVVDQVPKALKKLTEDKQTIGLLTLQDQVVFPRLFEQIIEQTSDQISWVIKRHPKHLKIDLSGIKAKVLFGKDYDGVSFLTLIKEASVHLTECSTAVIEADYFGVPSVVTGEQGILNYSDFIEQGSIYHVESASEFEKLLIELLEMKREPRMGVVNNSNIETALKTLLENNDD
jgi:hypothetical protein